MKNRSLIIAIAILFMATSSLAQITGTFIDKRDGKTYKTVKIGTQTWMAENLAYKTSSGCWAYNEDETNVAKYGYLYNWETAKSVSPSGWHLPSDAEWTILTTYLGGDDVAGYKLSVPGTTPWGTADRATNETGFTALRGGIRNNDGTFNRIGHYGGWWSSTESMRSAGWGSDGMLSNEAKYREIGFWTAPYFEESKKTGFSVRCVWDF